MRKKVRKRRAVKPDDYFNNGMFELMRVGENILINNNCTLQQQKEYHNLLVQNYGVKKAEIDSRVNRIRQMISICDPLALLCRARDNAFFAQMLKFSEFDYDSGDNASILCLEYIQSVLVSSKNTCSEFEKSEDQTSLYDNVLTEIEDLYKEVEEFFRSWAAYIEKNNTNIDPSMIDYVVQAQMFYWVRGNRYQKYELQYLYNLLPPHNDVLVELFGMSSDQILDGLARLQYALSQARADYLNSISELSNEYSVAVQNGANPEEFVKGKSEELQSIFDKSFGTDLNDVSAITGWNKRFIDELALGLDEYKSFYGEFDFSGWPILDLPITKKPFIRLGGTFYCFNYYALFDNFYRALQKVIFHQKPEYVNIWAAKQQSASETMVEDLFKKLLPDAITYRGNYYPQKESLKHLYENDLLVLYEDVLFIVEVKAGSFPTTPPIVDYEAHITAFKNLIEKADHQCERTYHYIVNHESAVFYTQERSKKVEIKPANFREIYSFSVTVENFNEFAARAEKLSFLQIKSSSIAIAYDDLLVYSEYFNLPLLFLHFLKQRKLAIQCENVAVFDELDHLGMYIIHNVYSLKAQEFSKGAIVVWSGYRQELDHYFCQLYHSQLHAEKPIQNIPSRISEIINVLDTKKIQGRAYLSTILLDFSNEGRNDFVDAIDKVIKRQMERGYMIPVVARIGFRYCIFVHMPKISVMGYQQKYDYAYSEILRNKEVPLFWIDLYYDENEKLYDIFFKECRYEDIEDQDFERLQKISVERAAERIARFKIISGKHKIGRNECCPCGSGKKYKRCCGS